MRDSELVSTFGEPAVAIDLEAVADARLAGVAVKGFSTHLSAAQGSTVSVARSELRLVTTDADSTVREGWPPVPAASSDPGYEGLVIVDGATSTGTTGASGSGPCLTLGRSEKAVAPNVTTDHR